MYTSNRELAVQPRHIFRFILGFRSLALNYGEYTMTHKTVKKPAKAKTKKLTGIKFDLPTIGVVASSQATMDGGPYN